MLRIKIFMKNYLVIIKHIFTMLILSLLVSLVLANEIVIDTQQTKDELTIHWWMDGEQAISSTKAVLMANNKAISKQQVVFAPDASLSACYLFLTDTSLSMKGYLKTQVIPLLTTLVDKKQPQHLYAIGRFDVALEMLSTFSNKPVDLHKAIKKIQAKGQRTELFRAGLKGLEQLDQCQGYRKVLVLLSDGDAEDLQGAYSLQDVTTEANKKKIAIVTVSFKDSIQVQNLLKLSEETGGIHFSYQLDKVADITDRFGIVTDNGAYLTIKLQNLPVDLQTLTIQIILSDNSEKIISLELPDISPNVPRITEWQKKLQKKFPNIPLRVWPIALSIMGIIIVLILISLKRRTKAKKTDQLPIKAQPLKTGSVNTEIIEDDSEKNKHPIAKIQFDGETFVMDSISISIGALPQNDFVINDPTVGRHQATIDYKDNKFYISDRGAVNKSQVNGEEIKHCELHDGDELQFGNWQGEFFLSE